MGKFQKGQSGNPGGRPKALHDIEGLARQHTAKAMETLAHIYQNVETPPAVRVAAINSLMDRAWGKPRQGVDIAGDKDNPITHAVQVCFVKAGQ